MSTLVATHPFGLIAGNGTYPFEWIRNARQRGVTCIVAAAFENETDPALVDLVDHVEWMRVGQLGRLLEFFKKQGVREVVMAGQIAPGNLFHLRPDFRALLLLSKLRRRNAETIFGAIADELSGAGIQLLPATTHMEDCLAGEGHIAGPVPKKRRLGDFSYGMSIAREMARLDIGQSVLVKNGTVLAVEAFEGTNAAIARGGALGRGGAVLAKVSKPGQDFRFDVPVIGLRTLETAAQAGVTAIVVEAGRTLLLDKPALLAEAARLQITIYGSSTN